MVYKMWNATILSLDKHKIVDGYEEQKKKYRMNIGSHLHNHLAFNICVNITRSNILIE